MMVTPEVGRGLGMMVTPEVVVCNGALTVTLTLQPEAHDNAATCMLNIFKIPKNTAINTYRCLIRRQCSSKVSKVLRWEYLQHTHRERHTWQTLAPALA